jgi:hypothetical protein
MSERKDQVEPAFFKTDYACRYLALSATMLKECRQAGLIEFVPIGDDNVRYTQEQLDKFKEFVKAGGLRGVHQLFLRLGVRKRCSRRTKRNGRRKEQGRRALAGPDQSRGSER